MAESIKTHYIFQDIKFFFLIHNKSVQTSEKN